MDPTQPLFEPLGEGADYALSATADGARFVLRYKAEQMAADLQGEDAARFRADYATIRSQFPDWPVDQTLASSGIKAATAGSPRRMEIDDGHPGQAH
jgi:hypothetical protein